MNRPLRLAFFVFQLILIIGLLFPAKSFASEYEFLSSGQIIDSDYLRAGNVVQIDGEIKGDAFLAGGLVTINGKIDGDLFVAGGKVNINGEVGNSIRVLGGDVIVNGPVGRNILLLCGTCSVTKQSTISGSLLVAGGNLEVTAPKVGRGFRFLGSRLFLNSEVADEAFVVADREFLLGPQASITGSLKYTGSSEVVSEPGATVGGNISYQKTAQDETYPKFFGTKTLLESYKKIKPVSDVMAFFVMALVGFVLLGLFPKSFEKVISAINTRPYACLGWGLIIAIGIPVALVLFTVSIVGIPVAVVLALLTYLIWLVAQYLSALFIGRKILLTKFGERRGWAMILGLAIIFLLGLIPVLGNLIKIVLILFSLGGMALAYRSPVIVEQQKLPFEYSTIRQTRSRGKGRR